MYLNLLFVFLFGAIGCTRTTTETKVDNQESKKTLTSYSKVILVNGQLLKSRCGIADLITRIGSYGPKAIGLFYTFDSHRDLDCDKKLQSAISSTKIVVLAELVTGDSLVRPIGEFAYHAMASGPTTWNVDELGRITSFYRVIDVQGRWLYTFPMQLALQFDESRSSELSSKSSPRDYDFTRLAETDSIPIILPEEVGGYEDAFKNKIVIVGDLGPDEDDVYNLICSDKAIRRERQTKIIGMAVISILEDLNDQAL